MRSSSGRDAHVSGSSVTKLSRSSSQRPPPLARFWPPLPGFTSRFRRAAVSPTDDLDAEHLTQVAGDPERVPLDLRVTSCRERDELLATRDLQVHGADPLALVLEPDGGRRRENVVGRAPNRVVANRARPRQSDPLSRSTARATRAIGA